MNAFYDNNKKIIDVLTDVTGRHPRQTEFLMELLNDDFEKLLLLEEKIKNNYIFYCPGDIEEIQKIISIKEDKSNHFSLDSFKNIEIYE